MKKLNKINDPFGCFCYNLGFRPTVYSEALTYEEQLLWLIDFLQKTVIPAVNDNTEAVEELQGLYIELKSYVDNYFDNLDVQEEVDNKLDEMVEQGTLQEIITSYLQVNGVLAYDTISDMSYSQNLIDGSTCYCLGDLSYNDGKGGFYKVREIVNTDVVDDFNLVALDVSNTLVAERMPDYYINNLQSQITTVDNKIFDVKKSIIEESCLSFAHRGLSYQAPENTKASIYKAGFRGCAGIEVDIQVTSDGKIILMHDLTVDRTTDGTGTVNELTSTYIDTLTIDDGLTTPYPTQTVPYLEDVLNICNRFNMIPMLELKGTWNNTHYTTLINMLKNYRLINKCIVISFNGGQLLSLRALNSDIKMCRLSSASMSSSLLEEIETIGNCGISLDYTNNGNIDSTIRNYMIEHNIPFGFWTVDSWSQVTNVIKNNPGLSFIVSGHGYGGAYKQHTREIICQINSDGVVSWQTNSPSGSAYEYEQFTFTTVDADSKRYGIRYIDYLDDDINSYTSCILGHIESNENYKYELYIRGQRANGFDFHFVNTSTGEYVSIADVYADLGHAFITFNVTGY